MKSVPKEDQCQIDESSRERHRREIPGIVDQLVLSCEGSDCFEHVSPEPIPSRESIIALIEKVRKILFPGYFISTPVDRINLGYYFGQEVTGLFEALAEQITLSFAMNVSVMIYPAPSALKGAMKPPSTSLKKCLGCERLLPRMLSLPEKETRPHKAMTTSSSVILDS